MKRRYRANYGREGLCRFRVRHKESDLLIQCNIALEKAAETLLIQARTAIEDYIRKQPEFIHARAPMPEDEFAPPIVREMLWASRVAHVGPMAAVAGAISEWVGRGLMEKGAKDVIIENGGDCFLSASSPCTIGIWAGASPFSDKIGVKIEPQWGLHGVCTSSRTIGHSLSLGGADAVTVLAGSAALADAVATAVGNVVKRGRDVRDGLRMLEETEGVLGGLIVCGKKLGAIGKVEVVAL